MSVKINYLLNKSGTITLPEEKITWFNTKTNQIAETKLPEKTFQIIDTSNTASAEVIPMTTLRTPASPAAQKTSVVQKTSKAQHTFHHHIAWHIIVLSALLCISLTCFLIHKIKTRQPNPLKPLKKACFSNQPQAAHRALLIWAQQLWPKANILNLDGIITQTQNIALQKALQLLSKALFQPALQQAWEGKTLWMAIQSLYKTKKRKTTDAVSLDNKLPPLNPA